MSQVADVAVSAPLTILQEEEKLFQESVRRFAKERLAPHVRAMDEEGKFRKDLLREMFEMGLMGIDIKEQYGGQGGSFFQSVLAIEELAKVDPSASVIVDVQNTLVSNAIERWASARAKAKVSFTAGHGKRGRVRIVRTGIGLGCVCADDSRGL